MDEKCKKMLEQLEDYFKNTSKEKIMEDWKETEKYSKVGPSVDEYLSYIKKIKIIDRDKLSKK